ncbi:MAG: DUF4410 domain-containing protein [Kiritimatiellae bacterium]|nr:DUF4410 domain-containing protein [Kiritimatiellia bacterium]
MKIIMLFMFGIVFSLASGCASFVTPTSYLAYYRLPSEYVSGKGLVKLYWADKTVSLSPYKNIVVKQFIASKTVGATPLVNPKVYSSKLCKLMFSDLKKKGKNVAVSPKGFSQDMPYLIIEGRIAQINSGNKRLRAWLPGQAGRAIFEVEVKVSRVDRGTRVLCAEFTSTQTKASGRWGGKDADVLDICMRKVSGNISAFMATHRNQ